MTTGHTDHPFMFTLDEIDALQADLGKSHRLADLLTTFLSMDHVLVTIDDGFENDELEPQSVDAVNDLMGDIRDAIGRARQLIDECYRRSHTDRERAEADLRKKKKRGTR